MNGKQTAGSSEMDRQLEQDIALLREADPGTGRAEPPELIDRAVLNMARRALPAGGRRAGLRWLGAFATAAVVVLAFSLVLQQDPQAPPPADTDELRLDRSARSVPPAAAKSAAGTTQPAAAADHKAQRTQPVARLADEPLAAEREAGSALPDPAAWIERMLLLQRDRAYDELEAELSAFREAFPDYPLPPELQH